MLERNIAIKNYINKFFVKENKHILHARENSQHLGLPNIQVPAQVGKLISLLVRIKAPKRILEIGTLGAYSTLWIAESVASDAKIICLEIDPHHASVAREHIQVAGYASQIEIREGNAQQLLNQMQNNQEAPFDLIFIDADKENYPAYLDAAILLSASGTLILSDNLIPKGDDIDPNTDSPGARGIYQFNKKLAEDPRLESILSTTIVGEKGRIDALGITLVK